MLLTEDEINDEILDGFNDRLVKELYNTFGLYELRQMLGTPTTHHWFSVRGKTRDFQVYKWYFQFGRPGFFYYARVSYYQYGFQGGKIKIEGSTERAIQNILVKLGLFKEVTEAVQSGLNRASGRNFDARPINAIVKQFLGTSPRNFQARRRSPKNSRSRSR